MVILEATTSEQCSPRKTILFHALNSPGHINPMVALADILKYEYAHRCVFLIMGTMLGDTIAEHGHEIIEFREKNQMEFYELNNFDDPEENDRQAEARGEKKIAVSGCQVWPQIIVRNASMFRLPPLEALIGSLSVVEKSMVSLIRDNHAQLEKAIFEDVRPDLIVIDAYFIPPCIVKQSAIPWMRIYSANPLMLTQAKLPGGVKPVASLGFSLKTRQERERMRRDEFEKWAAMTREWAEAQRRVREAMEAASPGGMMSFVEELQCPPPPEGQMTHDSPHLNVHTYPRALDYDQDDDLFAYKEREFRLDSLIRKPFGKQITSQFISDWQEKLEKARKGAASGAPKQVVFLSLGSIASGQVSLMKKLINILSEDQERLYLVSKGIYGDHYELPSNMIGGNFVPQIFFLDKSDLAIVHGGNNTINECCYFGKPMIVLPAFSDQLDNAQRVQDLGLGKRLELFNEDSLKSHLLPAISELLSNDKVIERCRLIGEDMRARDEPRKAAFIMDKLAREASLSQEFIELCRDRDLPEIKAKLGLSEIN